MAEYIERKALREAFDNADADVVEEHFDGTCDWGFGHQNILEVINSVPAAEVAPVRHGRWERTADGAALCTACKRKMNPSQYGYAFCSLCGAKMDGGAE